MLSVLCLQQSNTGDPLTHSCDASDLFEWLAGLALGVALLGLPWKILGVMLAGKAEYYTQQQQTLTEACSAEFWQGMSCFCAPDISLTAFPPFLQHINPRICSIATA